MGPLLGQGGMGQVYRAYDTSLKREVALKLLKSEDAEGLERFRREAQAQARVDHENVCKVYETGELDGRVYVAMQLIEGEPLFVSGEEGPFASGDLQRMTVEEKVRVMQRVAEGIHAAHREGLIHRDIKPSNVMLERTEKGEWKPYVLDFGLAREVASAGVTSLGLAVGTPNFMAPEQARGEGGALDRRTDVYGLGATLYAVLSGRPPFEGPSSLEVLVKVTEAEAPPLSNVPADLATIVGKCLQKEPSHRYESARALAEDLGRYLDGEPILARRTSLGYRLGKKARKHKALVAVTGAAAVVLLGMGAASVRLQLRARERARLAAVFGQEVRSIESILRIAHLAPRHDITAETDAIRERMRRIGDRAEEVGSAAAGPAQYALGRGHLALKEYDVARRHLEAAWEDGQRGPEVASALGLALGGLYQRELEKAERIRDPKERADRKKQIEREYRDPALRHLAAIQATDAESPEYVAALVAFYEGKHEVALEKASQAVARFPWLHEAKRLQADVHAAVAAEMRDAGRAEEAQAAFVRAEAAYRAALEIGRSDPGTYEGLARLAEAMMQLEIYGQNRDVGSYLELGLEACARALEIAPRGASIHRTKSALYFRMAEHGLRRGRDPKPSLATAIEAAGRAVALDPADEIARYYLGISHSLLGWQAFRAGDDPRPAIEESNRILDALLKINPAYHQAVEVRGINEWYLGDYAAQNGGDPRRHFDEAVRAFEASLALKPNGHTSLGNLAGAHLRRASWNMQHGRDPRGSLRQAIKASQALLRENPGSAGGYAALVRAYTYIAEHERTAGKDPWAAIRSAVEMGDRAEAAGASCYQTANGLAYAFWLAADVSGEKGDEPGEWLGKGRRAVKAALESNPTFADTFVNAARLELLEGRWRLSRGRDPSEALDRADAAVEAALRSNARHPEAYRMRAEAFLRRAEWRHRRALPAAGDIARAQDALDQAFAVNPAWPEGMAMRASLYALEALARPAQREALEEAASRSLAQALAANARLEWRRPSPAGSRVDEARR